MTKYKEVSQISKTHPTLSISEAAVFDIIKGRGLHQIISAVKRSVIFKAIPLSRIVSRASHAPTSIESRKSVKYSDCYDSIWPFDTYL